MAPKKGGGGGGGGGVSVSISSCPGAFKMDFSVPIPNFVDYCLYLLFDLVVFFVLFNVRKNYPNSRKLLGWAFILAVFFNILGYILLIISVILYECQVSNGLERYRLQIAYAIFFDLCPYFLLVAIVLFANSHVRAPLGGSTTLYKILYGVVLGFMGLFTVPRIVIVSYNYWPTTKPIIKPYYNLEIAYQVFYMLSVLVAGIAMFGSINQLKARGFPTYGLIGWVAFLLFSVFVVFVFSIASVARYLEDHYFTPSTRTAFLYIEDFFSLMTLIAIICIAKHRSLQKWTNEQDQPSQPLYPNPGMYQAAAPAAVVYNDKEAVVNHPPVYAQQGVVPQQQQYQFINQANGQPYYQQPHPQQQQPVYNNGLPAPMSAQAPEVVQAR